jgi:glucokinase
VVDGEPLAGAHGRTGEIGHVHVHGYTDPCPCGGNGCLETVASARSIAARYARRGGGGGLTAAQVADEVKSGNPDAIAVWTQAIEALAEVLAGCVAMLDPGAVVLGGGLAKSGPQLLVPLRAALAARVTLGPPPPVTITELGDRAALVGAGLLAERAFRDARRALSR